MPRPRIFSFCLLLVVLLISTVVLQACQLSSSQPTQTEPATQVSPTSLQTQEASPTLAPSPSSQAATASIAPETPTPSPDLAKQVDQALIEGVDWYVGIESMKGDRLYSRNTEEGFAPASMIKIPIALVVLKILEFRGDTVEDIQNYGISRNFSELLEAMVVRSEETATDSLEYFARGDNRLRSYLDWWGLKHTTFDPRRSTVEDLLLSLKLIYNQEALNEEFNTYLLDLMSTYTENDAILLGVMMDQLPDCTFYNKRGTLLNPTIVSDMGILKCGDQTWYLVIAGTPAIDSKATFEDIQVSIEDLSKVLATYVQKQIIIN